MERSVMCWSIYTLCNNRGNYTHHLEHLLHCGGTFKILFCNCFQADNALLLAIVTLCAVESDVGGMFNLYLHTRRGWRKAEPLSHNRLCGSTGRSLSDTADKWLTASLRLTATCPCYRKASSISILIQYRTSGLRCLGSTVIGLP